MADKKCHDWYIHKHTHANLCRNCGVRADTPEGMLLADIAIPCGQAVHTPELRPALCLDLDGTIQRSAGGHTFVQGPEDVELYPGVESKLWQYRDKGYLIAGVTNQGGVAYGYKTAKGFQEELDAMIALFQRNPFHCITRCYSHEGGTVEPYNHRSLLRKPSIGMLAVIEAQAVERGWILDWDNSLMVGDRPEDYELAQRAGIRFEWAWEFFGFDSPGAVRFTSDFWERRNWDIHER